VEDAIKAVVTRSANDAAVVIGEAIGGTESNFAEMMTRKARALGMSRTTYKNASGLPDDDQVTTARDQAMLGRAIQDRFPRYYRYFATNEFRYRGSVIRNHNHLLGSVEGVDGIKTGYTRASGFNLVTSLRRGNRHLVGVVLGGRSGGSRDAIMRNLLAQNLDRASSRRTVAAISERNPADYKLASTDAENGDDAPAPAEMKRDGKAAEIAAAAAQNDETARSAMPMPPARPAAAASLYAAANPSPAAPVPAPATPAAAPAQAAAKPPAPMTSGVIAQPLPIIPGSAEPMTPVKVRTVQIKAGQTRVASAAPSVSAPASTASIPATAPQAAETSNSVIAKADPLPPQNPRYGTGQGILGTLPASALQQHATTMASAEPAPRAAPAAIQPAPTPQNGAIKAVARSGWIIQVGALESESEAKQRLEAARDHASGLLSKADPFTEPVLAKDNRKLYRARFAGLDRDQAEAVCKKLKRADISCMTVHN
jgi:D-alanyl-D-alanine carboxypeptidase